MSYIPVNAQRIVKALEPFNILCLKDVRLINNAQCYAALAAENAVPIGMSKTLTTRYEYREFFGARACNQVMFDLTCSVGFSPYAVQCGHCTVSVCRGIDSAHRRQPVDCKAQYGLVLKPGVTHKRFVQTVELFIDHLPIAK